MEIEKVGGSKYALMENMVNNKALFTTLQDVELRYLPAVLQLAQLG